MASFPYEIYSLDCAPSNNRHDNLLTDSVAIKNEYRTEFQCRLRKREIRSDLKWYESFQNRLLQLRIKACKTSISPNFLLDDVKQAVGGTDVRWVC